ncbi:MAG: DUF998 domain-containing protein [Candidatus Methanoplasma sp.]|jgi:hypothetical membrane protein|nr:DUF998 domain-containing protein [Candidatus Methanoplasma sp.]
MTDSKNHNVAFAWAGMLGVAVFIIAWMCADAIDTAWQFGVNTLSEFGVSDTDARLYFNYGCCWAAGLLMAVFGIGRALNGKNEGHIIGGVLLFLSGIALVLIGFFTLDDDAAHKFIAVSAALFLFMSMIAITAGNWAADRKVFAGVGVVVIFILVAMLFAYDLAELEAYGIIAAMVWFLAESVNLVLSCRKG